MPISPLDRLREALDAYKAERAKAAPDAQAAKLIAASDVAEAALGCWCWPPVLPTLGEVTQAALHRGLLLSLNVSPTPDGGHILEGEVRELTGGVFVGYTAPTWEEVVELLAADVNRRPIVFKSDDDGIDWKARAIAAARMWADDVHGEGDELIVDDAFWRRVMS